MIRAILDESAPRKLARLLSGPGLDVAPFPNRWKGTLNGRLLNLIEQNGFAVLVTCDKRIPFQQNLAGRGVGLVVLPTPELEFLSREVETIVGAIRSTNPGQTKTVRFDRGP